MEGVVVVFVSLVTIIGMVLTYRLLRLVILNKQGHANEVTGKKQSSSLNGIPTVHEWNELAERAERLQNRLSNLEEILQNIEEKAGEKS
jgi:hypothetical protein